MLILFDNTAHQSLQPLSFTRPVGDLRMGILTIAQKWAIQLHQPYSFHTQAYLSEKFPLQIAAENTYINASICPDADLIACIHQLQHQEALYHHNTLIAFKYHQQSAFNFEQLNTLKRITYTQDFIQVNHPEDIIKHNASEIEKDFILLSQGKTTANISPTNTLIGHQIFIEEGVEMECCTLNTLTGPIYIGKNAVIMEGAHLRGPIAIANNAVVKMSAKIYGGTTVGPHCTVGGELKNSVLWGNSNKGHEGYLGDSVVGEWCNFGADTNNSNLKNNYDNVKLWDYSLQGMRDTGLQFCGLIMADHVKTGINTMFNTGTVVGVSANIFGGGYPPNFIPDFSWGGAQHGLSTYILEKALETAKSIFKRKKIDFDSINKAIFNHIFNHTQKFRKN